MEQMLTFYDKKTFRDGLKVLEARPGEKKVQENV